MAYENCPICSNNSPTKCVGGTEVRIRCPQCELLITEKHWNLIARRLERLQYDAQTWENRAFSAHSLYERCFDDLNANKAEVKRLSGIIVKQSDCSLDPLWREVDTTCMDGEYWLFRSASGMMGTPYRIGVGIWNPYKNRFEDEQGDAWRDATEDPTHYMPLAAVNKEV